MDEMRRLVAEINEASYQYYTLSQPTMTDREWDALYEKLKALEAETGVVLRCRPQKDQKPAKPALVDLSRGKRYVAALDKAEKTLRKLGKNKKDLAAMRIYEQNRAWAETSLREQLLTIQNLTAQLLKDLEEG